MRPYIGRHVQAAIAAGPDALGFVFWPRSPRAVQPESVRDWTQTLPGGMIRVGVFVDTPVEQVQEIRAIANLDVVQLHGSESPAQVRRMGGRIWKALPAAAFDPAPWIAAGIEAFLFDAFAGPMPGGTGRCCDWEAAAEGVRRAGKPVLLAGGLTPDNAKAAVAHVRPWGVDVSSGVEKAPGQKDPERIRRFIEQCRGL